MKLSKSYFFLILTGIILTCCVIHSKKPYQMNWNEKIDYYTEIIDELNTQKDSNQSILAEAYYERGVAFYQKAKFENKKDLNIKAEQDIEKAKTLGYQIRVIEREPVKQIYNKDNVKKTETKQSDLRGFLEVFTAVFPKPVHELQK